MAENDKSTEAADKVEAEPKSNTFVAAMRIKTAKRTKSPNEEADVKYIEPGEQVTGLSNDEMKRLWDSGAIRRATMEEEASFSKVGSSKSVEGGSGRPDAGNEGVTSRTSPSGSSGSASEGKAADAPK